MTSKKNRLDELAIKIAEYIKIDIPVNVDLWSTKECAALFKKTPKYFSQYIAPNPDFPKPIRVPTIKGKSNPLWKAKDVLRWVDKYQT